MIVKLTHPFLHRCIDPVALLKDCVLFNTFTSRLEKQAKRYAEGADDGWIRPVDKELLNKYKGDGFELFGECFIRVFGSDRKVGIDPASYKVVEEGEDRGVDGFGVGLNGKTHTVQFKYRQANYVLSVNDDHLANFATNSYSHPDNGGFGVDPIPDKNGKCNMTIIHSGKGSGLNVKSILSGVREILRKDIRRKVDNNIIFWNTFRDSWEKAQ